MNAKHLSYGLAGLAVSIGGGWLALQSAIGRNGPAVLDTVDRIAGGARDVELVETPRYADHPEQKLRVYRSSRTDVRRPVVMFVHGGSWRSGSPDDYGFVARALVPEGFVVVLAGYRLGDDGRFPAMLEDTASAFAWTKRNIARHGGNPERIFIAGHSAGAYNAAMIALDPQWLRAQGLDTRAIAGVIGLAGPYDFYPFDSDSTKAAFGGAPVPQRTQPVNFARADAPPMLLLTGEKDTTVKPRNSRALAAAIRRAGGPVQTAFYEDFDHTGMLTALASPWRRNRNAIDRIVRFTDASAASVPVQPETP